MSSNGRVPPGTVLSIMQKYFSPEKGQKGVHANIMSSSVIPSYFAL